MKRIILNSIIFLLGVIVSLQAQSPKEWAPIGAKWSYYYTERNNIKDRIVIESIKDTIIQEKQCKFLTRKFYRGNYIPIPDTLYLWQDIWDIYIAEIVYPNDPICFKKYYDINSNVGDRWGIFTCINYSDSIRVDSLLEPIEINGIQLKQQFIEAYCGDSSWVCELFFGGRIIEKIGWPLYLTPVSTPFIESGGLICYYDPELGLYRHQPGIKCWAGDTITEREKLPNSTFSISPNPCINSFELRSSNILSQIIVYNLQGIEVKSMPLDAKPVQFVSTEELPKGVYILKIVDIYSNVEYTKLIKE